MKIYNVNPKVSLVRVGNTRTHLSELKLNSVLSIIWQYLAELGKEPSTPIMLYKYISNKYIIFRLRSLTELVVTKLQFIDRDK